MEQHNNGVWWGIVPATLGGIANHLAQVNPTSWEAFLRTLLMAFICGVMGAIGKHAVDYFKDKYLKK